MVLYMAKSTCVPPRSSSRAVLLRHKNYGSECESGGAERAGDQVAQLWYINKAMQIDQFQVNICIHPPPV